MKAVRAERKARCLIILFGFLKMLIIAMLKGDEVQTLSSQLVLVASPKSCSFCLQPNEVQEESKSVNGAVCWLGLERDEDQPAV